MQNSLFGSSPNSLASLFLASSPTRAHPHAPGSHLSWTPSPSSHLTPQTPARHILKHHDLQGEFRPPSLISALSTLTFPLKFTLSNSFARKVTWFWMTSWKSLTWERKHLFISKATNVISECYWRCFRLLLVLTFQLYRDDYIAIHIFILSRG